MTVSAVERTPTEVALRCVRAKNENSIGRKDPKTPIQIRSIQIGSSYASRFPVSDTVLTNKEVSKFHHGVTISQNSAETDML
jgi:hypothetical protein